jgi:hypothetical protein
MKPILFNTEMIRAILDGKKTVTRRLVKPQPITITKDERNRVPVAFWVDNKEWVKPKYQVDEVLYVRETFKKNMDGYTGIDFGGYIYKADCKNVFRDEYNY